MSFMDVSAEDLKDWAGRKAEGFTKKTANAARKAAGPQGDPNDEKAPEEEQQPGAENEPGFADEMEGWIEALAEDHPKTAEWLRQVGAAIEEGNMEAVAQLWDAAPTDENPAYPELSPEERQEAGERIGEHMGHNHPGGREQAIAIGLRQAAPGKYDEFEGGRGKKKAEHDGDEIEAEDEDLDEED